LYGEDLYLHHAWAIASRGGGYSPDQFHRPRSPLFMWFGVLRLGYDEKMMMMCEKGYAPCDRAGYRFYRMAMRDEFRGHA